MADDRASIVRELAAAASAQSQVANRYWIALITVCLIAVLPRPKEAEMSLPFDVGPIEPSSFYLAMFALLVVLNIAFASAHAQQIRVQRLAHRGLDHLGEAPLLGIGIHPRDLFDAFRLPSVIRLAPLPQLLRGLDSGISSSPVLPRWRKKMAVTYYVLLKIASWLVYFGFPCVALWITFVRTQASGWLLVILGGGAFISTVSLIHVLLVDIWYVNRVKRAIV
jgi:hypothetical protein